MLGGTEILTTAQMRAIESAAIDSGKVTGLELMERAGAAVVDAILAKWPEYAERPEKFPWRATVLCGPGNNGGDGFVIARLLAGLGWETTVEFYGDADRLPADARLNYDRWCKIGKVYPLDLDVQQRFKADVLVDALFGIGLSRPVDAFCDYFDDIYAAVNNVFGGKSATTIDRLVAVDVPSFLCADSGRVLSREVMPWLEYDMTVTFHRPKIGHVIGDGPELCGALVVADIGLFQSRSDHVGDFTRAVSVRASDFAKHAFSHKFDHGHALIIAGGIGHGGAARLSARAALRVGAGLVTLCPPKSALIEHSGPPDALMRRAVDDAATLAEMLTDKRISALCIGPGCGVDRAGALLPAVLESGRHCVLDADALTALAGKPDLLPGLHKNCVLTPHAGEFARLFPDLAERLAELPERGPAYSKLDAARQASARCGAVVLLKGPDTVIAGPDGRAEIHSAYDVPWLATAGSGDVLAGLITGLLARNPPEYAVSYSTAFQFAANATALHAAAARRFGPGLIADDLPDQIPGVFRDLAV
ncbi:NAD(P)H-hydrate dehydratase [Paracoccus pacificus]|uniref:Bifunctional NAD(P)H-hydrate repair enzyme n=1 Tax=Paracoccus pacificus TaxID=1463598 RepID=A0ABW4R911_9RHOB